MNDENTTTTAGDVNDTPPWNEDEDNEDYYAEDLYEEQEKLFEEDGIYGEEPDPMPQELYQRLSKNIIGQDEAKKVVSMAVFNTFAWTPPRRQVVLFVGKTGSGKTELWRQAKNLIYQGKSNRVVITDASTMAPEGWCGSNAYHISDVIRDNHLADGNPHILVLDEFDKCCQPAMSSSTDYNKLFQDGLLKLFDGDIVTYGSDDKKVTLDASMITIVLCGAFSGIYELKDALKEAESETKRPIGFMTTQNEPDEAKPETEKRIEISDLIRYGMRSEIAGRISKIVELQPPTIETMERIGVQVARKLSQDYYVDIAVTDGLMHDMAQKALDSGLGARYIRGQIQARLDDLMFNDPYAHGYTLQKDPETEKDKGCDMQP